MEKVDFDYKINDKVYNETFARHLLATVYDSNLKYSKSCDKPDIWNTKFSHGIEVTTLTDTYYNTLNRYKQVWARRGMTLEQIVKHQPAILQGKLGINKYGNLILLNTTEAKHTVSINQKSIVTTITMKLRKLQNYKIFNKNDLFIFAPNLHSSCTPAIIHKCLNKIDRTTGAKLERFNNIYDTIIIYTFTNLYIFPFKNGGNLSVIKVLPETCDYCDRLATIESEKQNFQKDLKKLVKKDSSSNK